MSTPFLQFSVIFFRLLIGSYSQLYRDRKHPLFSILMGLQALFIATQGSYTPRSKRRQNAFILEMTSGSLRYYSKQCSILDIIIVAWQCSSVLAQQRSSTLAYQLDSALVQYYTSLLVQQFSSTLAHQHNNLLVRQRSSDVVHQLLSVVALQRSRVVC